MITLYGIKNCDTVKKARKWLDTNNIDYQFHDVREDALMADQVENWVALLGWEPLLNRRSTTWRQLDEADKNDIDAAKARALIMAHPTLLKRPLLEQDGDYMVGFKQADYDEYFNK